MQMVFPEPVVILANGPFPTHPIPLKQLHQAGTIICTDGSADKAIRRGFNPHIIIGDMDSTKLEKDQFKGVRVPVRHQENTDLTKVLEWCREEGIHHLSILGSTGARDDHTFGNYILLAEFYDKIDLSIVTDFVTITCHKGEKTFHSFPGQTVSLITLELTEKLTTTNLKYKLFNEPLGSYTRGISNEALTTTFTVISQGLVWVLRSH